MIRNNLPIQRTSFIGRQREIASIVASLGDEHCRLLTIVGQGGIGKTRLSLEAGRWFLSDNAGELDAGWRPASVFLASVQGVATADDILPVIATATEFEFHQARDRAGQLIRHFQDREILLILDNLEHLPGAAPHLDTLLTGTSGLKILATSRRPLDLPQEWLFHLDGLAVPDLASDELEHFDAVQLFTERARRARHDFSLEENRACVVRLCRLTEGMPLAIELATSWLRRLSCHEIASEVQRNLDILASKRHGVPDRHRSVRAVFDYSWQLLEPAERALFMKLSVFRGGFDREAAEQVAGADLFMLSSLIDQSLVNAQSDGRYQIHELQRQFGEEHLAHEVEMESVVRDRHSAYFTALMDRPFRDFYGYRGKETLRTIDTELENVRAAWGWAVAHNRFEHIRAAADGLYHYGWLRHWHQGVAEALDHALAALRATDSSPERDVALGHLLSERGTVYLWTGRNELALSYMEEGIAILEPLPAPREYALAKTGLAWNMRFLWGRDPEVASDLLLEAVKLLHATGQHGQESFTYGMLAGLAYDTGAYEVCRNWYQKGLDVSRRHEDPRGEAAALSGLGRLGLVLGQYEAARNDLQKSLEIFLALADQGQLNAVHVRLGQVATATGDFERAEHLFALSLASAHEIGRPYNLGHVLTLLGRLSTAGGDYPAATEFFEQAARYTGHYHDLSAELLTSRGELALATGAFASARTLLEQSLATWRERGSRMQATENEQLLGQVALAQEESAQALAHMTAALEGSVAVGAPPIILTCLVGTVEWFVVQGDAVTAIVLGQLVYRNPASRVGSKQRAERLLLELKSSPKLNAPVPAQEELINLASVPSHNWRHTRIPGNPGEIHRRQVCKSRSATVSSSCCAWSPPASPIGRSRRSCFLPWEPSNRTYTISTRNSESTGARRRLSELASWSFCRQPTDLPAVAKANQFTISW